MANWLTEIKNQAESFIKTLYSSYKAFVSFLQDLCNTGQITMDVLKQAQSLYTEFTNWCKETFHWAK